MSHPSGVSSVATSRRSLVKAGAALLGVSVLGLASRSGYGQAPRTRMDIVTFAQDLARLARFEGAVKEMQDRSARDPNDPRGWLANANMHRDFCSTSGTSDAAQIHFLLVVHRLAPRVYFRDGAQDPRDFGRRQFYLSLLELEHRPPNPRRVRPTGLAARERHSLPANGPARSDRRRGRDFQHDDPDLQQLGVAALAATFFEAKRSRDIPLSFGGIARPNSENRFDNNAIEGTPHGPVHNFSGGLQGFGPRRSAAT